MASGRFTTFCGVLFAIGLSHAATESTRTNVFYELGQELSSSTLEHVDLVEVELATAGVDVRGFAFDQLLDEAKISKACKIYKREEKNMKNAALCNLLRVACERRREILKKNSECLSKMEVELSPQCEEACVKQFDLDSADAKCKTVACAARCLDAQMRECAGGEAGDLARIYSEFAGSQLAVGLRAENNAELRKLLTTLPEECSKLARIPLDLIAAPSDDLRGDSNAAAGPVF